MEKPIVSIMCNTYNHEKYIADALEGFLMQETTFPYEILIHDDASTDKTPDIIKEYEKKYPEVIKPIYQKENQYSKGIGISSTYQYPRAEGKYIALCEGDDYWIDKKKLQKQYEILEQHKEIDMCTHKAMRVVANTKKFIDYTAPADKDCILPVERFITRKRVVETASLFFRKELNNYTPQFTKALRLDTSLRIKGALRGGMYYINDCMSVYRWLSDGSWTSKINTFEKSGSLHDKYIKMLVLLDEETHGKYHDVIEKEKLESEGDFIYEWGNCRELKAARYEQYMKSLSAGEKIKRYLKIYFPGLFKQLKELRSFIKR